MPAKRLETAPVDLNPRHAGQIKILQAAQVDRRGFLAIWRTPKPERGAAADRAEVMLDHMPVEGIGTHRARRRQQANLLARDEPKAIALATAVRAVALDTLLDFAFNFVGNPPTVTTAVIVHVRCSARCRTKEVV